MAKPRNLNPSAEPTREHLEARWVAKALSMEHPGSAKKLMRAGVIPSWQRPGHENTWITSRDNLLRYLVGKGMPIPYWLDSGKRLLSYGIPTEEIGSVLATLPGWEHRQPADQMSLGATLVSWRPSVFLLKSESPLFVIGRFREICDAHLPRRPDVVLLDDPEVDWPIGTYDGIGRTAAICGLEIGALTVKPI